MVNDLNFTGLAEVLLARWEEFLPGWAPGGKVIGREWTAGGLRGGPGDSFKFNIETGRWADFAGEERGGDMISLYAAIQGIKNGEAAKRLADMLNYNLSDAPYRAPVQKSKTAEYHITRPPKDEDKPKMYHAKFGEPTDAWCYCDTDGSPIFWEARYDTPEGKQIVPWSWADNVAKWVRAGFPAPRPLYGLDQLSQRPNAPVVVVEGPKCARAAQEVMGGVYVPVTWTGGSNAANKTDWSPLTGRKVLIWPDADEPGIKAAGAISKILLERTIEIKILDVKGMPEKWDIADAQQEGWDWGKIKEWARPRAQVIAKAVQVTAAAHANGATAMAQTNVVVNTAEDEEPGRAASAALEELGISCNRQGVPNCNIDNSLRALENSKMMAGLVWFDTFHQKIYTSWNGPHREWSDRDTLELTKRFQRELAFIRLSDTTTFQAVTLYAHAHPRNEPHDWMETLKWDNQERIGEFFTNYLGAKDSEYVRAASKNFWIGMVARIYNPGSKMDNMIVLEGAQGTMKSTALHKIGGKWFTETNESVANKDFFLILQGNLLVEIAELHTFSKAEVTRIKQVISCRVDRYRAPYERLVSDHPRQSVFVGSTNEDAYLKDTTGNRRFWPIKCGTIYPDEIADARDQLFAEAVHKFKQNATWWEMPKDETLTEQEERRQTDAWEAMVSDWIANNMKTIFTTADLMRECLQIDAGRMDKQSQHRVAGILKSMGWEAYREYAHGHQRRIWRLSGADLPLNHEVGGKSFTPEPPPNEMQHYADSNESESQDEGQQDTLL